MQSGVGRTGKWWAHEHVMDGTPDIVVFAKGIASGFPFAGAAPLPLSWPGAVSGCCQQCRMRQTAQPGWMLQPSRLAGS